MSARSVAINGSRGSDSDSMSNLELEILSLVKAQDVTYTQLLQRLGTGESIRITAQQLIRRGLVLCENKKELISSEAPLKLSWRGQFVYLKHKICSKLPKQDIKTVILTVLGGIIVFLITQMLSS